MCCTLKKKEKRVEIASRKLIDYQAFAMQLKSNNSMLSLTKSINMASDNTTATQSSLRPITRIERTSSGRFVVKKANSVDDECSSEAISSCSDNDDKLFASKCHRENDKCQSNHNSSSLYEDDDGDDENSESDDSDADLILNNFDVTLVDDGNYENPKNDAERMFFEVVELLRFEQEVGFVINNANLYVHFFSGKRKKRSKKKEELSALSWRHVNDEVILRR